MNITDMLRQGRRVYRTLYLVSPDDPNGDGELIGMVDNADLAAKIVRLWNEDIFEWVGSGMDVPLHMREID